MSKVLGVSGVLVAVSLVCAGGNGNVATSDASLLQGEWRLVSNEKDGRQKRVPDPVRFTFKDNRALIREKGQKKEAAATFALDEAAEPKHFDFTTEEKGGKALGIYKLSGDSLTICIAEAGQPRPTAFKTTKGSKCELSVLQRIKESDDQEKR